MFFNRYEIVLETLPNVETFFPRSWGYINHIADDGSVKAFVVMGMDPSRIKAERLVGAVIRKGRALNTDDENRGIIGEALAAAFDCTIGDTIEISASNRRDVVQVEVVGLFTSAVQIYTADLLLVTRDTANNILGYLDEDECSDIVIYLKNPNLQDVVSQKITDAIDGARPLTKTVIQSLTQQSFGQKSGFFYLLWFIMLINTVIIAWSLLGQISFSMKKEIGILKAIGWDTGDIMVLKTFETLTIAVASVLTGLIAGIGYMLADAPGMKRLIIGWADIYPDYPIPLYIDGQTVIMIALLGILPVLAGMIVPVWRIGTIDPDEAIRQ